MQSKNLTQNSVSKSVDDIFEENTFSLDEIFKIADMYEKSLGAGISHLFIVNIDILVAAFKIAYIEKRDMKSWGDVKVPLDAKRHGQLTLLAIEYKKDEYVLISLDEEEGKPAGDQKTIVSCYTSIEETEMGFGHYIPGDHIYIYPKFVQNIISGNILCNLMFTCSLIMSLINQPNITSVSPALSRQQRRARERSKMPSSDNWNFVRWNIGEGAKARAVAASGGSPRALHWRRGHWRTAEQHYKGAVQRGEDGWWQWIEGMWVGHPAFGVIKSVHAPKIAS